jgi:transcriptional regulator with XRE-family HTH domain
MARMVRRPSTRPSPKPTRRRTFFVEWREHRGLTQAVAAERIGITQATLSRTETGKINYTQGFLEAAAAAYRCEPADLLMRNPLVEDAVWSISDNLRKATPSQLSQAREILNVILKKTG